MLGKGAMRMTDKWPVTAKGKVTMFPILGSYAFPTFLISSQLRAHNHHQNEKVLYDDTFMLLLDTGVHHHLQVPAIRTIMAVRRLTGFPDSPRGFSTPAHC